MNLNENILRVKELMGLLLEQSQGCNYKNWQNGDGIKRPKITESKSPDGVTLTYQGPETGFCIQHKNGSTTDSLHQLAGAVRVVVSEYLKELYAQGSYVRPDLKNIVMNKSDNYFEIRIPFIQTTEDKAITNFNERGGWGHDGSGPLKDYLSTIQNPKYGLIDMVRKTASGGKSNDIIENWVSFRDLETYPIKSKSPQSTLDQKSTPSQPTSTYEQITIKGDSLEDLRDKMKQQQNISISPNSFDVDLDSKTITFETGQRKVKSLSFIFDDKGQLENRLPKIHEKNPNMIVAQKDLESYPQYAVLYFY